MQRSCRFPKARTAWLPVLIEQRLPGTNAVGSRVGKLSTGTNGCSACSAR